VTRLRLGYASPLPPARSGIADYSAELVPALAAEADLTLFVDDPKSLDPSWRRDYAVTGLESIEQARWNHDLLLYHMGNSTVHADIYRALLRYPGLVVLHETNLHSFIAHHNVVERQNSAAYVREWAFAAGHAGAARAQAIAHGAPTPLAEEPLNRRLLRVSLGAIVHSESSARRLRKGVGDRPVFTIPMLAVPRPGEPRRDQLPWPEDAVIFATLGYLNPYKQIDLLLRAFTRVHAREPRARLLFVGEAAQGDAAFHERLAEAGVTEVVHHVGFVPTLEGFVDWIHTADVVITLRHPTLGETSAGAIRALAAGRPQIVFDHGWYAELPDAAALKVPPLDEEALVQAMIALARAPERCATMGAAAKAAAADAHAPAAVARRYVAACHQLIKMCVGE
jgi:glycosyltransferase involved in cell wall biosynthesis